MNLTQALRQAIHESSLSLHAISQASGVSYPSVYYFVKTSRPLSLENAERLAAYFDLTIERKQTEEKLTPSPRS